jgi:hypothetical protein
MEQNNTSHVVAQLNDLLRLDLDAIAAYRLTLKELESQQLRQELRAHLADHERHIEDLGRLIEGMGGMKISVPHESGVFKLAVQAAVAAGSDRTVLLAFKANEMQVRDKYARMAEAQFPPDVASTVRRAAGDEQRHYDWAVQSLERMGASEEDTDVRVAKAFRTMHARSADAMETVELKSMYAFERIRRVVKQDPVKIVVTTGLAFIGAGVVLRVLSRRR